ncbi:MAG TPA: DUF2279 domain-containing protein [Spirochaetota bacterium]|nr:DUF2279 domain-containing protein [Spirochaetota bacterium]HOD16044.1 DUF2279 domain-containing protein [Spirochaetota bacterium]HPN10929.1 DUF2279 domain-containing protein [Spirochaetota bacterium]HQL81522.1 DUF2279 domain-containing protein [Spirochaetota bacterium]
MKKACVLILSCVFLLAMPAFDTGCPSGCFTSAAYAAEKEDSPAPEPETVKKRDIRDDGYKREVVRYVYSAVFPALVMAYGFSSWGWAKRDFWLWSNEGWFGHTTRYGGYDKLGHVFSHYTAMRLSCAVYNYTERGSNMRFLYGGLLTMLMGLSIEVGDAYSGYGFSYHDLVFDSIGILIGGLLEAFPKVDAFVSLSWEYWPSEAFRKHLDRPWLLIDDYGGAKVLLNIKLAGFREVGVNIPNFFRYIMIDIGYGVKGYTAFEREAALDKFNLPVRSQNLYVGISINFVEVIKDLFKDPESPGCRASQQLFKYYHIPAGYKHRINLKQSLNTTDLY